MAVDFDYRRKKSDVSRCGAVKIPKTNPAAKQIISLEARFGPLRCGNLPTIRMQYRYCLSRTNKNNPDPPANTPQPHT
jgi:hypothetical protein